jgi:hypothetical protein
MGEAFLGQQDAGAARAGGGGAVVQGDHGGGWVHVGATLSCVFVSKSLASWRSCSWLAGSPCTRLTMRPRRTAGRCAISRPSAARSCRCAPAGTRRLRSEALGQLPVPGPDGHVGDGVVVAGHVAGLGQAAVQHVHLALDFHGVAVDGVLDLFRRVGIEVAETAAQETARCPSARTASSGIRRARRCRWAGRRRTSRPGTSGSRRTRTPAPAAARCGPPARGSWSWGWPPQSRCQTARPR